jgi:hypothetical protein
MLSISLFEKVMRSKASVGHTGAHIPHPLHTELLITAIDPKPSDAILIASKGQASEQALHHVQSPESTKATIGSVSKTPLLTYENDFVAAERAELTDSIMFLGP